MKFFIQATWVGGSGWEVQISSHDVDKAMLDQIT